MNTKSYYLLMISLMIISFSACDAKKESQPQETVKAPASETVAAKSSTPAADSKKGAGVISGMILFEGEVPGEEELMMDADPVCMSLHADGYFKQAVEVSESGGVKNAFVYLKEGVTGNYPVPSESVVLDQKGCVYQPSVLGVQTNQTILIKNSDDTLHNVHALPEKSDEFNLGMPLKGMTIKKSFSESEVMVRMKCDVHPWMTAHVGVVNHPFFQVTDQEGKFSLNNVPDGDYVVEVWHEKLGVKTAKVKVEADEKKEIKINFS